jgi:hypothetical protein
MHLPGANLLRSARVHWPFRGRAEAHMLGAPTQAAVDDVHRPFRGWIEAHFRIFRASRWNSSAVHRPL